MHNCLRTLCLVVVLTIVACEGCKSTANDDGPHSTECSSGPPWSPTNYPPFGTGISSANECIPRCGNEQKYPGLGIQIYSLGALPSGDCQYEGEVCGMAASAISQCPGQAAEACSLSLFECRCGQRAWKCTTVSQGAGGCACTQDGGELSAPLDAGLSTDSSSR